MTAVQRMREPLRHMPTEKELHSIPLARAGEYELSDHETKATRQRIYALNKDNIVWRWRTLREGSILLIWRIRKAY